MSEHAIYLIGYANRDKHANSEGRFPVKIGCCRGGASDPYIAVKSRLKAFQIGSPYKLEIYSSVKTNGTSVAVEKNIHDRLNAMDRHIMGEWYWLDNDDLCEITEQAKE